MGRSSNHLLAPGCVPMECVCVCVFFFFLWNASRICVSSLRRGHANLLCIVPILVYVLPKRALECVVERIWCSDEEGDTGRKQYSVGI